MRLYFHILRAHAVPFLFSLATLMFVFLLQFLMKFIDQLVGKGLSPIVIGELISLSLAWMVVLAVPMSVLVATLMAFGGLSARGEITAMKASGMSLYRMMMPAVCASVILTYLLFRFDNDVLPEANHRVKVLMTDIRNTKPTLSIVPGLFTQELSGYSILARKTFENSNDLEGVTIYDYTDPTVNVVVTAKRGRVSFTPDQRKLVMDLFNGEIHRMSTSDMQWYRRMKYVHHRIIMNAEGFDFERSNENSFSRGDRELSVGEMGHIVDSLKGIVAAAREQLIRPPSGQTVNRSRLRLTNLAPPGMPIHRQALQLALDRARSMGNIIDNQLMLIRYEQTQVNQYLVEIHKKYSIPLACLVFVFIGAPLGIMARRGTFAVAASLSFGFFLLYWASLIGGEKLADRAIISPWVGMWAADIIIGLLGIALTVRMARETPTIHWSWVTKLVPKTFRAQAQPDDDTGDG